MIRVLGFVLLQTAAVLYAQRRVTDRRRETDALRSFCDMLDQMQGLLENDASPMPELLQKLSERSGGEARSFVDALDASMRDLGTCSFRILWQKALTEKVRITEKNTVHELETLGCFLGRYDLQTQLDALTNCQKAMRQSLDKRINEHTQDMYMTVGLSLSLSLMLGILLL